MIVALLVIVVVVYFTYTPIISSIIAQQLQNAVDTRLHAALTFDSLTYGFPYRVHIKNARIKTDDTLGGEDLFTIEQLDLTLVKLPLPHRPVVIQNLELRSPAVHLIRSGSGIVGKRGLGKTDEERRLHPPEHPLSEMFELRRFAISDGAIDYVDRERSGVEPLVFRGINADMGVTPQSRVIYAYTFRSSQPPFVEAKASGTMDIDRLILDLKQFAMTVESKRVDGESSLPPSLQRVVNEFGIAGKISLDGVAQLPLRDMSHANATVDMGLAGGRAILPRTLGRVDAVDGRAHGEWHGGQAQIRIGPLSARSGAAILTLTEAIAQARAKRWQVTAFSGQLDAVTSESTTQPTGIANYHLLGGAIGFRGDASGDADSGATYSFVLEPRDVALRLPGFSRPIESLNGAVQFSPGKIEFQKMQGNLFGGTVNAAGTILTIKPGSYDATVNAGNIDLSQLTAMPVFTNHSIALSGTGDLNAHLKGIFPADGSDAMDRFSADGELRITNGGVLDSKVVASIADQTGAHSESRITGDAAAVFTVHDRMLDLSRAAVNTSVLGLHGHGTIGFDGVANLDVIAAPFGDWKKHVTNTGIPFVSGFAGRIVGGLQKIVNTTSRYLYEFQVTGNLKDPQIRAIPAPAVTDKATNLFGKMLQGVKSIDLLKSLKESG